MKKTRLWLVLAIVVVILGFVACDAADTAATDTSNTDTPVPTPTLTMLQSIQQVVQDDGVGHSVTITYDSDQGLITVNDDIGEQWDNGSYQSIGRLAIFNIQQAIWTSTLNPNIVTVNILGPVHDQYGNQSEDILLSATLQADTASLFVWDNLDPDMAWKDYDSTFTSNALRNGQ